MLTLAIPTLRRFDLLRRCVASALESEARPGRILVVDNSGGGCPELPCVEVVPGRQPQSVARAWNDAVARSLGRLVICNDDVQLAPATLGALLATDARVARAGVVGALEGAAFACFLLRRQAYAEIGPFDEGFAPAYFEDTDYARRLALAGWEVVSAPATGATHAGSATIGAEGGRFLEAHHPQFRANEARYLRKWGGRPGAERYEIAYGGR